AGEFRWKISVFDQGAAQRFLPLEVPAGEDYTDAWYHSRLPEDRERTDATSREALRSGASQYSHEFRCRRSDGEICWIYEQAHLEPVASGRWRLAGVCTEITDRKRLEQELIQQAEELAAADRGKNEFLAMLAHE